jgi:hypothetical protein
MPTGVEALNRDDVVRELTRHCGDGRLTLDELEARIQEAYAATTDEELQHALRELPPMAPMAPFAPTPAPPAPAAPIPPAPPAAYDHIDRDDHDDSPRVQHLGHLSSPDKPEWEKAVGTLFAIGGFVLLFNGMFWLAMICWFVLPGLVLKHRGR